MAIPDYQSIMLPLLKKVSDGKLHRFRDLVESLAEDFKLTEQERKELLNSGRQAIFDNRVGWASTYLKKSGLLTSPERGAMNITTLGLEILSKNLARIDVRFLQQFPSFIEFQAPKQDENEISQILEEEKSDQTPEENLENSYLKIRKSLAQELINKVLDLSPSFFERLVVELLVKMGYGGSIKDAGKAIGKSGDEGIDGTIKEDKLGLDIIYIQAKN
jgi:restriction system protein